MDKRRANCLDQALKIYAENNGWSIRKYTSLQADRSCPIIDITIGRTLLKTDNELMSRISSPGMD
jgi:hypothetical protein